MRSKSSAMSGKWPSSSGNAAARFSMSLVIAGRAGPPSGPENFRPLYSAGLWLAVMLTPPSYLLWMIAWAGPGVAVGSGQKTIAHPFFRSTPAAVRANSGEKKRVSCPTTSFGFFFSAETCPAMAAEARRTPPKVKSSAITPRQPEVPKWIVCFVTGDYCILARELKSRKNGASRKSQRGWAAKNDGQNRSTRHLWFAKRGAEDSPCSGGAAAGCLRQRDWCPGSLDASLEGKNRVGEGVFATDQDEQGAVRGGARCRAEAAQLRGAGNYRLVHHGGFTRVFELDHRVGEDQIGCSYANLRVATSRRVCQRRRAAEPILKLGR